MIKLAAHVEKKKKELEEIIRRTDAAVHKKTDVLRVSSNRGYFRYFIRPAGAGREAETFCRARDRERARVIAQTDYEKALNKAARDQYQLLTYLSEHLNEGDLAALYTGLTPARKALIHPIVADDEMFAQLWEAQTFEPKPIGDDIPEIYTVKGERVRSKSEKIIADYYASQGIPYRYECPLILKDGERPSKLHPDFTVLNKRTRGVFYHEHLGMMDSPDYCRPNLKKIERYEKNGLFPGDKLLITYETSDRPLDMRVVEALAKRYLLS